MTENGRLGIGHLTFDRELSLHVDLAAVATEEGDERAGDGEDGREVDDGDELAEHCNGELEDEAEVLGELAVDCLDVLSATGDDTGRGSLVQPTGME